MGKRYQKRARMERARNLPEEVLVAIGQNSLSHERFDEQILIEKINDKVDANWAKVKTRQSSF